MASAIKSAVTAVGVPRSRSSAVYSSKAITTRRAGLPAARSLPPGRYTICRAGSSGLSASGSFRAPLLGARGRDGDAGGSGSVQYVGAHDLAGGPVQTP